LSNGPVRHTITTKFINNIHFKTFDKAGRKLFKYMEMYYNLNQKHSAEVLKTPAYFY